MDRADLVNNWKAGIEAGSFLTPKHHPSGVGNPSPSFRSITTLDESGLGKFLDAHEYIISEYYNNNEPQSPAYYVIKPSDPDFVPGSGIPPQSPPTHALDRLVVVSGTKQGWHIFANQQDCIDKEVSGGNLVFKQEVL